MYTRPYADDAATYFSNIHLHNNCPRLDIFYIMFMLEVVKHFFVLIMFGDGINQLFIKKLNMFCFKFKPNFRWKNFYLSCFGCMYFIL